MNHHLEEHYHVNHDNGVGIAHNTRIKRRDMDSATPSPSDQASTSNLIPCAPVTRIQLDFSTPPKKNPSNKKSNEPQFTPNHSSPMWFLRIQKNQ